MKPDQNVNVQVGMNALVQTVAAEWNDVPESRASRGPGLVALAAALLGACATPAEPPAGQPRIRHYAPPEIVIGTSNSGRFETSAGCIFFRFENRPDRRAPALFAPGTRFSSDRRYILLPSGGSIKFGRRVTIAFEAPPNATGLDSECGANPLLVFNLVVTE
jgi:hypothetical protein